MKNRLIAGIWRDDMKNRLIEGITKLEMSNRKAIEKFGIYFVCPYCSKTVGKPLVEKTEHLIN